MLRSRGTIVCVILVIWALIFCIPYLISDRRSVSHESSKSKVDTDLLLQDAESEKSEMDEESMVGNEGNTIKDDRAPEKKKRKDEKEDDDDDMHHHKDAVINNQAIKKIKRKDKIKDEKEDEMKDVEDDDMHKDAVINTKPNDIQQDILNDEPRATGEVRQGEMCLDTLEHKQGERAGIFKCHGLARNQYWHLTKQNLLRNNELCLQAPKEFVILQKCDAKIEDQHWEYNDGYIGLSLTKFCLDSEDPTGLSVRKCDFSSKTQKWKMSR